jgi:prophage regulatory protein
VIQENSLDKKVGKHWPTPPTQRQHDEPRKSDSELRQLPSTFRGPPVLLRRPQVLAKLGIARATLYQWLDPDSPQHLPDMPRPFKLSERSRCCYWIEAEVDQFIAQRVELARQALARGEEQ